MALGINELELELELLAGYNLIIDWLKQYTSNKLIRIDRQVELSMINSREQAVRL